MCVCETLSFRIASSHKQMQRALTVQTLQGPLIDELAANKKIQEKDVFFIHWQKIQSTGHTFFFFFIKTRKISIKVQIRKTSISMQHV